MVNYQLGKIYKLVCNTTGLVYIGSTCEPKLSRRLVGHRGAFNHFQKGKGGYVTSFSILENDNYEIVLIENFPSNSKDELHARERFFVENNECVNITIPYREQGESQKIYREENKEKISLHNKTKTKENKDKIKLKSKDYYENNKEKLSLIHKQYREANKETILLNQKIGYETNKEKINQKQRERYENNKDKMKQKERERYEKNKDQVKQKKRERYEAKKLKNI